MSENTRSNKKRKAISATLTVAMAATMLLSGTLAYFYQSSARNTFVGTKKEVAAHDDFAYSGTNANGDLIYNKDIYVENIGATPVFVRVKLTEDFQLDDGTAIGPITHIPAVKTADSGFGNVAEHAVGTEEADVSFHDYFKWEMGSNKLFRKFLSARADAYRNGSLAHVSINEKNAWQDNSGTNYDTLDLTVSDKAEDEKTEAEKAEDAQKLDIRNNLKGLPRDSAVITMEEYLGKTEDAQKGFTGWVIDNTPTGGDGWAYWSQMLQPGKTTGVLLNAVTVSKALANSTYEYNINVQFEVVDQNDEGLWYAGKAVQTTDKVSLVEKIATDGAKKLLDNAAAGSYREDVQAVVNEMASALNNVPAEHQAVRFLYQQALDEAKQANLGTEPQYAEKMYAYKEMAENLQALIDAGTDLSGAVLKVNRDDAGNVSVIRDDNGGTLKQMDDKVAAYIMATYDFNGDNVLSKEESYAVTIIRCFDAQYRGVASMADLSAEYFPNMRDLTLKEPALSAPLDLSIFNTYDPDVPADPNDPYSAARVLSGLWRIQMEGYDGEIDLEPVKSTLRECLYYSSGKTTVVKNLGKVELLTDFIAGSPNSVLYLDEINSLLSSSGSGDTLNSFSLDSATIKECTRDEDGNVATESILKDAAKLNLGNATKLSTLWVKNKNINTGVLNIASNSELATLTLYLLGDASCDISQNMKLNKVDACGVTNITGNVNGVTITNPKP